LDLAIGCPPGVTQTFPEESQITEFIAFELTG
jgi:hypothetical protein